MLGLLAAAVAAAGARPSAGGAARAPVSLRSLQMIDRVHGYAVGGREGDSGRLLSTATGGRTWVDVTPEGGRDRPIGPLTVAGATRLFATRLRAGVFAVVRSDDAGSTWSRSNPIRDPRGQSAGAPLRIDGTHLYLAIEEGVALGSQGEALFGSSDGGRTWRLAARTDQSGKPDRLPFGCDKNGFGFLTRSRGWAGGACAGGPPFFYRTDDGGRTWRRQSLPVARECVCETAPPRFFTATRGVAYVQGRAASGAGKPFVRVLWTRDRGGRWVPGGSWAGQAAAVGVSEHGAVWIVGRGPGPSSGRLLRTSDGGAHWDTTRIPFDVGGVRLDALGGATAFAYRTGGLATIWVSRDGGRRWHAIRPVAAP